MTADEKAREQLATWMLEHSFATGHGDTVEELLGEASWQVEELREENSRLREALEADPTIEMLIAGRKQCFVDCNGPHMGPNVEKIWRVMARAALSPKAETENK